MTTTTFHVNTVTGIEVGEQTYRVEPGGVTLVRDVERVRSDRAVKPRPLWTHADSHGHAHYWMGNTLPTLERRMVHVPCDGSCGGVCGGEGYDRPEYRCRECGDVVEPGYIPDDFAREVGIAVTEIIEWTIALARVPHLIPAFTPGHLSDDGTTLTLMATDRKVIEGAHLLCEEPDYEQEIRDPAPNVVQTPPTKRVKVKLPPLHVDMEQTIEAAQQWVTYTLSGTEYRIPERTT